ncbi:MAG: spore germination protein GerW family protein [Actinomycetota bacterium]
MATMQTELLEKIHGIQEAISVRRAFGEPYEKDGVTVIPAARVSGGAGGGGGEAPDGEGSGTGTGFGLSAKPFGVFVIADGDVSWRPAVDVNRVILGGQLVAIAALLMIRAIAKTRARSTVKAAAFARLPRPRARGRRRRMDQDIAP